MLRLCFSADRYHRRVLCSAGIYRHKRRFTPTGMKCDEVLSGVPAMPEWDDLTKNCVIQPVWMLNFCHEAQ